MSTSFRSSIHETITEVIAGVTAVLLVFVTVHAAQAKAVSAIGFFSLATLSLATGYFAAEVARQCRSESPVWMGFTVPFCMLCSAHLISQANGDLVCAMMLFLTFVVTPCVAALQSDAEAPAPRAVVAPLRLRIPARAEVAKACCQVCGERLTHDVVSCAQCDTPHHADCFMYAEKCSTYGCGCRMAA